MQLCRHVKFTICMIGQQARAEVPFESQGRLQQNPFSSRNHCLFQFRPSTELIRPNHSMEDNWLYSKSTDLNANLTKLSLHRNIQNDVWPISGYQGLAKLTHNLGHHKLLPRFVCYQALLPFCMAASICSWSCALPAGPCLSALQWSYFMTNSLASCRNFSVPPGAGHALQIFPSSSLRPMPTIIIWS